MNRESRTNWLSSLGNLFHTFEHRCSPLVDHSRKRRALIGPLLLVVVSGCGGGGGGSSGSASSNAYPDQVTLHRIEFPDPTGQNESRSDAGPLNVSLAQPIAFRFNGALDPSKLQNDALRVIDRVTNEERPVTVYISPEDPRVLEIEPWLPLSADELGGVSYQPDRDYECVFNLGNPSLPQNIAAIDPGVLNRYRSSDPSTVRVVFRTTSDPSLFWTGFTSPKLLESNPNEGAIDVAPFLLKNRQPDDGLFLRFDNPLDPTTENLARIQLIDELDSEGESVGRVLPTLLELIENDTRSSLVRVIPRGILPLGHRLSLTIDADLTCLGENNPSGLTRSIRFQVQMNDAPIEDVISGLFEDPSFEETDAEELEFAPLVGDWGWLDASGDRVLKAGEGFPGQGELGSFLPDLFPGQDERTITLSTDAQQFPLTDGSTPQAPSTIVRGGVFHFDDVILPPGITLRGSGSNPLVITAQGTIRLHGTIDVSGRPGTSEGSSTDNAVGPLAGGESGPGGARGGDGHPTIIDESKFVSPRRGRDGEVRGLGTAAGGGFSGIDPNSNFDCAADTDSSNSQGADGGGGGFFTDGRTASDGFGSLTSSEFCDENGRQIYEELELGFPPAGRAGSGSFVDSRSDNDYFGVGGEYGTSYFGGSGGGGGGSRLDSYHCGPNFFWDVVADARGGGGGGGGGVLRLLSLGPIDLVYDLTLDPKIEARGGGGGDGQNSSFHGGAGGDGAGGLVILGSAEDIRVVGLPDGAVIQDSIFVTPGRRLTSPSNGGDGILQVELPRGVLENWELPTDFVEPESSLIPLEQTPSSLVSTSLAQSRWIYIGSNQRDSGSGPQFSFRGLRPRSGDVRVDENGRIINPSLNDFRVDALELVDRATGSVLEPRRADFLPDNARIRIQFQSALELADRPGEIDPTSISSWLSNIEAFNGRPFIRVRILFDIARAERGYRLGDKVQIPIVRDLQIRLQY